MKLRVAYIPEHFLTPLFFAEQNGYYAEHGLEIEFVQVLEGTGRLIKLLNDNQVDIAIGLTEGFVADIGNGNDTYKIVDTYVKSPLCWAISSGTKRDEITSEKDLAGKRISVSRIGSGSYIMSFVLGLQLKFEEPYFKDFVVRSNFKNLRDSVNLVGPESDHSEAFMWEHFTLKKYYDNGEIKKIGEIYTPWPSWVVTVRRLVLEEHRQDIKNFLSSVHKGIQHFVENPDKAVTHISTHLDYTKEDATAWLSTVKFNEDIGVKPIDWATVVDKTAKVLGTAGVLKDGESEIQARLASGIIKSGL